MHSHWFAFPFFIPFPILLVIHRQLAMSDALMVQTPPGEREAHVYNFIIIMVFAAYAGAGLFLVHSLAFGERSLRRQLSTFALLALYWLLVTAFL